MSDRDDERIVEVVLREHGIALDSDDTHALVELRPVFRTLAERLREVALRESGPSAGAGS